MSVYRGRCGHCGANKNSENFKSRPAGRRFEVGKWLVEDDSGRKLRFFMLDEQNDRVCNKCYDKNVRLRQGAALASRTPDNVAAPPRKRCLVCVIIKNVEIH